MSGPTILGSDASQIRALADAIGELERVLNPGIAKELNALSSALSEMAGQTQAPASGLETLLGTMRDFNAVVGVGASVGLLRDGLANLQKPLEGIIPKFALLGGPKLLGIAAGITAVSVVVGALARAFGNSEPPVTDFTRGLNESREAHEKLRRELETNERSTTATARALFELAEAGSDCAIQTGIMRQMMADLNNTVPGLGIAFRDCGRKINMTEGALQRFISEAAGLANHEAKENRQRRFLRRWISYKPINSFFNALNSSSLMAPSSKRALSLAI